MEQLRLVGRVVNSQWLISSICCLAESARMGLRLEISAGALTNGAIAELELVIRVVCLKQNCIRSHLRLPHRREALERMTGFLCLREDSMRCLYRLTPCKKGVVIRIRRPRGGLWHRRRYCLTVR